MRFSASHSPVALYHFDRNLDDSSGNGYDLTGTAIFHEMEPQVFGLAPGSDVRRPSYDPGLALVGDMTIEVLGYFYGTPSSSIFASFTTTGETLATNTLWQLSANTAAGFRWIHEYNGTGLDSIFVSTDAVESLPRLFTEFHAAAVREGGVISFYLNGRLHGKCSAVLVAANGGTSSFLRVMFGATTFGLTGLKITGSALSASDIADEYTSMGGGTPNVYGSLWVGALTDTSATVVARMAGPVADLSLLIDDGVSSWSTTPQSTDADNVVRFDLSGLDTDTQYKYSLSTSGLEGKFRTISAASGDPSSFTVAFSGDAVVGSTSQVFNTIQSLNPLMFIHMGDLHYQNNSANNPTLFHNAYDDVFKSAPQHRLYRSIPTAYVWDDHDFGGDNCDGTSASKPAAASVYRSRVPHYDLPHSTAVYQTWDIGRVRFIMTDQRSESSPNTLPDNSSKTILGSSQKAWFKSIVANSPGMLLVWVCPRWFANANHPDSWNNFSTERAELVDWIKANAHGRLIGLAADQHYLGIDNGSHVDHATGGGEPLPWFQAAPLDKTTSAASGTWSNGLFTNNGQFGTMSVNDTGGSSIGITWTGYNSVGTSLNTYSFSVNV